MRVAVAKAALDDDAGVWYVEHSDTEGLRVEGETFEVFRRNVADAEATSCSAKAAEARRFTSRSSRTPPCRPAARSEDFGKFVRLPPPLTLAMGAGLAR